MKGSRCPRKPADQSASIGIDDQRGPTGFRQVMRSFMKEAMRTPVSVWDPSLTYDVLVLGGGNAALCGVLMARRAGCSVLIVESSPAHFRGGNSRHTRNL